MATTEGSGLSRRHEFVLFFDVLNGNPNGDPDAGNMPRLDPETNRGLVSDVALMRRMRNTIYVTTENAWLRKDGANLIDGTPRMTSTTTALIIHVIEGEPRVLDTDLGRTLGYARPEDIRKLIKRHELSLMALGRLPAIVAESTGGRRATEYRVNERQALFLITKADTDKATELTVAVIDKFVAYEAGLIQARPALPDFSNSVLAARAWADATEAKMLSDQRAKEAEAQREQAEAAKARVEAKVAELEPLALVGKMAASRSLRLGDFLRTLPYINLQKVQGRLVDMGVLYRLRGKLRVRRGGYGHHFLEGAEDDYGNVTIFPNAKGRALLVGYYKDNKLPMKAGHKPQSLPKAIA